MALLIACNKNEDKYDNYLKSLGIYEKTGDGATDFQINLDNGNIVVPESTSGDLITYNDGDRVIVYYSSLSELPETNDGQEIQSVVHYINDILTKDVITISSEISDSIGNDAIHVHEEDIWISNNFLNIYFSYLGYNRVHYLNLIKNPNDSVDVDGRLILEFRHNDNNDYPSYAYDGLVSFDMNSLQQPGIDSLPLVVKVFDLYSDTIFWKDTYHFESENESSKMVEIQSTDILIQ
jgi:hypothetical protein